MAYKKRRSSSRSRLDSRAYNSTLAYLNPFSNYISNPKVPDGRLHQSAGVRFQASAELRSEGTQSMAIMLTPFNNTPIVYTPSCTAGDEILIPTDANGEYFPNVTTKQAQVDGETMSTRGIEITNYMPSIQDVDNTSTKIDKWRVVSQAMKLMLVNNTDNNNGYFEAIRFSLDRNDTVSGDADPAVVYGTKISIDNLVQNPTYVSGKLRDLSKYSFQLKPVNTDHDPMEGYDQCHDKNLDAILVVLHADQPMVGTTLRPTKVLCHAITNQEFLFNENNIMARFHTGGIKDIRGLERAQSILNSSIKAARRSNY